jgi:hypothetical protein
MTGDASSTSSGTSSADVVGVVFEVRSLFGLRWRTLAADILTRSFFKGKKGFRTTLGCCPSPESYSGLEQNLETQAWLPNVNAPSFVVRAGITSQAADLPSNSFASQPHALTTCPPYLPLITSRASENTDILGIARSRRVLINRTAEGILYCPLLSKFKPILLHRVLD